MGILWYTMGILWEFCRDFMPILWNSVRILLGFLELEWIITRDGNSKAVNSTVNSNSSYYFDIASCSARR